MSTPDPTAIKPGLGQSTVGRPDHRQMIRRDFAVELRLLLQIVGNPSPESCLTSLARSFDELRSKHAVSERETAQRFEQFSAAVKGFCRGTPLDVDVDAALSSLSARFDAQREKARLCIEKLRSVLGIDGVTWPPVTLFEVIDGARRETAHTQIIAWMLDPRRAHGFGHRITEELLSMLSGHSTQVTAAEAYSEYEIPHGRLDVYARGKSRDCETPAHMIDWMLVIEAKLDAVESTGQLEKYEQWIHGNSNGCSPICTFLTPDGRRPETAGKLFRWKCVTYIHVVWAIRNALPALKAAPGYGALREYISCVLTDLCRWDASRGEFAACMDAYSVCTTIGNLLGEEESK